MYLHLLFPSVMHVFFFWLCLLSTLRNRCTLITQLANPCWANKVCVQLPSHIKHSRRYYLMWLSRLSRVSDCKCARHKEVRRLLRWGAACRSHWICLYMLHSVPRWPSYKCSSRYGKKGSGSKWKVFMLTRVSYFINIPAVLCTCREILYFLHHLTAVIICVICINSIYLTYKYSTLNQLLPIHLTVSTFSSHTK